MLYPCGLGEARRRMHFQGVSRLAGTNGNGRGRPDKADVRGSNPLIAHFATPPEIGGFFWASSVTAATDAGEVERFWKVNDAADLIRAIADLLDSILWPLVVLLIFLLLRGEIPGFARRLRRLVLRTGDRALEFELAELTEVADRLEAGADAVGLGELPSALEREAAGERGWARVVTGIRLAPSSRGSVRSSARDRSGSLP